MRVTSDQYVQKARELLSYSSLAGVKRNALKYGINPDHIYISTSKRHKWMYQPEQGPRVHFGSFLPPMEDYLKHRDKKRLEAFQKRNARWKDSPKGSASWLSYYLLWT